MPRPTHPGFSAGLCPTGHDAVGRGGRAERVRAPTPIAAAMPGSGNAPISLPYPSGSAANVSVASGLPLFVEQCDGVRVRVGVGSRPRRCV
ncbi:hypothetical protein [Bifidobacterium breve]|uniref:hypothetical protein n=1 Tax=Bifidobacterium breve TaxID=1685 RepID=UPI001EE6644E|nr:hypothetical protein [Bifidobacterium breve]